MLVTVLLFPTGALSKVCMSRTAIDSAFLHIAIELVMNGFYCQHLGTIRRITSEKEGLR